MDVNNERIVKMMGVERRMKEIVKWIGIEERYDENLEVIIKIKEDVNYNIRRILEFRDKWYEYEIMVEKMEFWMKGDEKDLDII